MTARSENDRYQDATAPPDGHGPWWLDGDEDCPHCEQRYALEMEVRCVDCDAPICPFCVVRVRARVYCPQCEES